MLCAIVCFFYSLNRIVYARPADRENRSRANVLYHRRKYHRRKRAVFFNALIARILHAKYFNWVLVFIKMFLLIFKKYCLKSVAKEKGRMI
jgi:hypothetical protein